LRTYEMVLVVQPGFDEDGLDAFISGLTAMIADAGGQIVDIEHMGRRRLAYPIKKTTEGHYVLLHANMENAALSEVDRRLKLSEDVLRYLTIRMDELMEPAPAEEATEEAPEGAEEAEAVEEEENVDADQLAAELADELAEDAPEA